jgi:hypothetical protein
MKILLVVLLAAAAVASLARPAKAQVIVRCTDLAKSSRDTIQTLFFAGKPNDTVQMPFFLKNDSICTGFQFLIRFDTSKLSPVFAYDSICDSSFQGNCVRYLIDSTFVDYTIAGRFVKTQIRTTPLGDVLDTVTKFQANLFEGRKNVVAASFLPQLADIDSLPPGRATIFNIKFKVKATALHNQLAGFTFFESDIYTVDSSVFPPDTTFFSGCNASQMTVAWNPPPNTQTIQIYPSFNAAQNGFFRVDTSTVANPTITFSANPTNISSGNSSNLSWTATNADSIVIRDGLSNLVTKQTSLSGSVSVSPTSTTTYTATAYNGATKTAAASATVTVGAAGSGPSISYTPSLQNYTINQGETVSFQVRATGSSGQTVNLTAGTLPNNATFAPTNPIIGTTTVVGTFSFTPDFNQKGSFSITFTGSSNTGTTNSSVLITVNELEKDRLFSTSAFKQKPVGGLRGTGGIKFPINLISAKTVYGVQFDMDYPYNYVSVDSFVVTNRIPDYAVYDNLGEFPGTVRVTTFGLINDSVKTDTSTAIMFAYMTLDSNAVPWTDYPINMRNGRESVNPDPNVGGLELQTDSGIVQCDNPGDVNLDKFIDVADVVNIVSSIIQTFTLNPRQFATADLIVNDSVNVFDLVADINLIYGRPVNPAPPAPPAPATIALSYGDIPMGGSDMLVVTSELPEEVAALQMDFGYDPNAVSMGVPRVTVDNANFILQYKDNGSGKMRVLLYAFGSYKLSDLIQAGAADLVNIPISAKTNITAGDKNKLRLTQALLSTSTSASIVVKGTDIPLPSGFTLAQNYPNPFNPTTTIEYTIGSFDDGSFGKHVQLEIYNVLGQLVRTLVDGERSPGSYREEWDATNTSGQRISSGVYLYRLQVGDENQTKKMLLLK